MNETERRAFLSERIQFHMACGASFSLARARAAEDVRDRDADESREPTAIERFIESPLGFCVIVGSIALVLGGVYAGVIP